MWDFGRVEALEPEAIGEPGQRTFRVRARSARETASLWLEKEQMAQLSIAFRQLLARANLDVAAAAAADAKTFPDDADVDFHIRRLGIGYDDDRRLVVLFAYATDDEDDSEPPTFSCQVSPGQCLGFAERAEELISKGRPLCLLCGGPIDPEGHRCVRSNGHTDRPISLA
jgi:uncharacterized repeat protein (TIGR03847 family)